MKKVLASSAIVALCLLYHSASGVQAQRPAAAERAATTHVCDIAYEDCREEVLTLIKNETVGIDLSFWFMTDARYSNEIVKKWKAGVPVRIIMDPRANTSKPANAVQLAQMRDAGIPMLNKPFGDIAHWKGMIFAGQNVAEFSGANYSPYEYVYEIPNVQYQDEAIYFSNEPDVVQSLMKRFDDVWMNSIYTFYANPVARARSYPDSYTIAPEFNLPPDDSYTDRLLPLLNAETVGIDVVMFRITDARPADALIRAVGRGVPVRLYTEPLEYRNPERREVSYNVDRMYMGGVQIKMRAHAGQNHQKTVRLFDQHTTVFGTSNWSTASDDNQLEVNYFTTKDWFYQFFADQFDWKWNNRPLDGSSAQQTIEFVPLAPEAPVYHAPADMATAVSPNSVTLSWYAGNWGRKYDVYFGAGSNPPLYRGDVQLGPSQSTSDYKSMTVADLLPGTTYAWKVVSKTMANVAAEGPLWRFTTSGVPGENPPPPPDTTAPSVFVYSPANLATISGTTRVSASASDNGPLAGVQFKLDGVNLGAEDRSTPFTIAWDTASAANGAHDLTALARDTAGNVAISTPIRVMVSNVAPPGPDTTPPTVSMTAPAPGSTVSGMITLSASGSDDVGVAGVQFTLDGVNFGAEDTSAPYAASWDTTSAANGTHTLAAQARDAAGNSAVSPPSIVTVSNTQTPPPGTIVLWARDISVGNTFGNWIRSADSTAAGGVALWNPDNGVAKIDPAPIAPQHYVDVTFDAQAGAPYHLWIRMRAQNDFYGNDSIHVQFSDAVDAAGSAIYRIGSTASGKVALQETDGGPISAWGWADQGWNGLGPHIYFATSGPHTLRIQQREDGVLFDQIVLSPSAFLTTPPGRQNRDDTIVPVGDPPPSDTTPPSVAVSAPADGATVSGTTTISAGASDDVGVAGVQFRLDGTDLGGEDTTAPYLVAWDTTSAGNGTHTLNALARDGAGNRTTSAAVSVSVSNASTPSTIVRGAANVPAANIFGNWIKTADNTAADGVALWNPDRGEAKIAPARVAPQHYVDIPFNAHARTAYHLWIRMRAQDDYYGNDSIHVQFSDAVDAAGTPIYRIGSSGADNSAQVVLQETDGGVVSGWGWADQGWNGLGPHVYFATSGPHTLRVQQREDGALFDQIVLSPVSFLTSPPPPGPLGFANHPPLAADDTAMAVEDTTTVIAVLANDSDPDGDSLSVTAVDAPAHGFAAVNGDGTISYRPPAEFSGADSFTYTVGDGNGATATATVRVIVAAAADDPAPVDDLATTREDTPVTVQVLANDSDADGDALSVAAVDAVTHGAAAVHADGTITYTPEANFNGVGGFTYTVSDGHGGTATSSVNVTVTPVNDGPSAADDVAATAGNTAVSIQVLANDSDPDGDSLLVSIVAAPQHGTVAVNAGGSVEYTPAAGYLGTDSFGYAIHTGAVTLAWDASPEPNVAGYTIHYGTQPGVYPSAIDVGPALGGFVHGLVAGQQYYFRASAYNTWRVQSILSGEVQAVVANLPGSVPETTATATVHVTIR